MDTFRLGALLHLLDRWCNDLELVRCIAALACHLEGATGAYMDASLPSSGVIGNHLVLHVDRDRGREWSLQEVVAQWCKLFAAPPSAERWLSAEANEAERVAAEAIIESWRERLHSISWFMRCL